VVLRQGQRLHPAGRVTVTVAVVHVPEPPLAGRLTLPLRLVPPELLRWKASVTATAPHARGVIAIDDSGDRKDGTATAHVGRQWLGRYGKTDNGIVTVATVWADERVYYPLHAEPYTPAPHFAKKRADPDFRTKLQIAADLVAKAHTAGVVCRAVVADCFYGDHDDLRAELRQGGWGSSWPSNPPAAPGSTAPRRTPRKTPPGPCRGAARTIPAAGTRSRAVVRLYGIRHWIEQS
jgi:hypothetical protein